MIKLCHPLSGLSGGDDVLSGVSTPACGISHLRCLGML